MEGNINWTTVAISWLLSTVTTVTIIFLASHVRRKCYKQRSAKENYAAIENFGDKAALAEWYSDKPLKTSSPCPSNHNLAGRHGTKRPMTHQAQIQDSCEKLREDHRKASTEIMTSHKFPEQNQYHKKVGNLPNNKHPSTKEENIFRKSENRTLIGTPHAISSNNVHDNFSSPAVESRSRSVSVHCVHAGRESRSVAFIKNLKSSPTEKKRQSSERSKTKKDVGDPSSMIPIDDEPRGEQRRGDAPGASKKKIFPSAGHLEAGRATAQRPPRPIKSASSVPNTSTRGQLTGRFEIRFGSNSPPPTLLPLTASMAAKKGIRTSHPSTSIISKSLSIETIPLRSASSYAYTEHGMALYGRASKAVEPPLPKALSCNSSC